MFIYHNADFITVENMRIVVDALGDDLNDEEILEMFEAADEDADGVVKLYFYSYCSANL